MDKKTENRIFIFFIQQRLFAIEIAWISRVIPFLAFQSTPGIPEYCKGLINFHGTDIAVIDLNQLLKISAKDVFFTANTQIILCSDQQHRIGIITDQTIGIESYDKNQIQLHNLFDAFGNQFIQGSIVTTHGDALLLNAERILAIESLPHGFNPAKEMKSE